MEVLFAFLIWVSSFSHVDADSGSKMDIHNLATVITPNILHPDLKKVSGVDDSFLAIEAVNSLIELNEIMSEVRQAYWVTCTVLTMCRFPKIFPL